jgi:hypothetical protein
LQLADADADAAHDDADVVADEQVDEIEERLL